jgi:hypothetical protein
MRSFHVMKFREYPQHCPNAGYVQRKANIWPEKSLRRRASSPGCDGSSLIRLDILPLGTSKQSSLRNKAVHLPLAR